MKKILVLLLAVTATVCAAFAFTACDLDDLFKKPAGGNSGNDGTYYKVTVSGADDFFFERLEDKYKAGTEVEVKLNVITDVSLYVSVNGKRVEQSHYDSDYWGYKFTMPEEDVTVFIITDKYYDVEVCDFNVPFYWANGLSPANVIKIKRERSIDGSPENVETTYTTDRTDIENICAVFNCKLQPCDNPKITGSYYTTYTFYTADAEYELNVSSGYAIRIGFSTLDWFKIADFTFPEIANPEQ